MALVHLLLLLLEGLLLLGLAEAEGLRETVRKPPPPSGSFWRASLLLSSAFSRRKRATSSSSDPALLGREEPVGASADRRARHECKGGSGEERRPDDVALPRHSREGHRHLSQSDRLCSLESSENPLCSRRVRAGALLVSSRDRRTHSGFASQ